VSDTDRLDIQTNSAIQNIEFNIWLGTDAIHDAKTGRLIRHEHNEASKQHCAYCWSVLGKSPLQVFLEDGGEWNPRQQENRYG